MDGERLWELWALDGLLGGHSCLCSSLEFAVLLRMTVLNVLQQVGLLHVEEWTIGAGKDLSGHFHSGTYAEHRHKMTDDSLQYGNCLLPLNSKLSNPARHHHLH